MPSSTISPYVTDPDQIDEQGGRFRYRPVRKELMRALIDRIKAMETPPTMLEIGSGMSTDWLTGVLKEGHLARLDSLEHLQSYADQVISDYQLGEVDNYEMHVAPLGDNGFYDLSGFNPGVTYDVVMVDGPPATTEETAQSRLPAIEVLDAAGLLKPETVIYLDDANRDGEKQVIAHWESLGWVVLDTLEGGQGRQMVAMGLS